MDFSNNILTNASTQFKFQLLNALAFMTTLYMSNTFSVVTSLVFVLVMVQLYLGRLNWIFLSIAALAAEKFFIGDFLQFITVMMNNQDMLISGLFLKLLCLSPLVFMIFIRKDFEQLIPKSGDFIHEKTKLMEWGMCAYFILKFCYNNFYLDTNEGFLFSDLLIYSLVIYILFHVQKSVFLSFFFFSYVVVIFCEKYLVQMYYSNYQLNYISSDSLYYFFILMPIALLIVMYVTDFNSQKQKELFVSSSTEENHSEENWLHKAYENGKLVDYVCSLLLVSLGICHFIAMFSVTNYGLPADFSEREYIYFFFGLVFLILGIWLFVGTKNGKQVISNTVLIFFSVAMGLALFRYIIMNWHNDDRLYLVLDIYFTVTYLLLAIPIVRMKSSPLLAYLYAFKRDANYLSSAESTLPEHSEIDTIQKVNEAILPWNKRKTHVIVMFIICFLSFYFGLSAYKIFLNHGFYRNEFSDFVGLIINACNAIIFSKIMRSIIRLDNAFFYFLICYNGLGLLGNLYLLSQDVEAIYSSVGVSTLIYLGILFYSFHLIEVNKKYRKDLLLKMKGFGTNDPDLLD